MRLLQRSRLAMLLPIVLLVSVAISRGDRIITDRQQVPLITLQASEPFFSDVLAMAAGAYNGQQRFYVFHSNRLVVYSAERNVLYNVDTAGAKFSPIDPVVDSGGNVYLINSATDEIVTVSATAQWGRRFRVEERPYSLALLGDGNIVIASPNGGKLLHVYDTSGHKLRSFGDIKPFDPLNQAQNEFLNRGQVLVDASGSIYFVFKNSPAPAVLKFSTREKLISEFPIEGHAIDLQIEPARRYLNSKTKYGVGGFVIINSAAIDPSTGHLWICMNGSSRSGVVYEYSRKGKKLGEYSVVRALPFIHPQALTHVTDILISTPTIYLNVDNGIYSVDSKKGLTPDESVFIQEETACPQEQSWPSCSANCPQGSCPGSINCKAILQGQIGQGLRIVGSSCQSLGPGQGAPTPKPNGGCIATVTTCDTTTGEQVTHTTNQDCNPVKYSCAGASCIVNCDGIYTTSTCNNACSSGGGGGPCPWESCGGEGYWDPVICACEYSPILIDTLANGFDLTSIDDGVNFDLKSIGVAQRMAWTAAGSDDAFLALDRNGNGRIDNGTELFGSFSPQPPSMQPNGFIALAEYDRPANGGNSDGIIDRSDGVFASLRLWQDKNHNGVSEASELHTLPSLGVYALDLDYKEARRRDENGNWFRYRAKVFDAHAAKIGRWACDVYLLTQH